MSLKTMKSKVTSTFGKQILKTQKHSPTILVAVGLVGVGATAVLASRATLKMDEILREAEEKKSQIDAAAALGTDDYNTEDAKKDGITVRVQTGLKIAKIYAPAIVVGIATVSAITGSHVILNRRNAALGAAFAASERVFKEYRQRVVEEFGQQKDLEFRFGSVKRELAVDTDEGVAVQTVTGADPETFAKNGRSQYAVIFDEYNPNWSKTDGPRYNQIFLKAQQNYANDILQGKGFLFLNDVYEMLGFPKTSAGQVVGWVKGNGDDYVSFGIEDTYDGMRFINGDERSVILDFNVDGVVWDKI